MKKVLVIEDEEELRQGISEILAYEGYKIFQANNGKAGLKTAVKESPDIILCDILMPDMDGYEVLRGLKNNNSDKFVPFIFLTALTGRYNYRLGMELGADDYLTKPFTRNELLKAVSSKINKYGSFTKQMELKIKKIEKDLQNKISRLQNDINEKSHYIEQISIQKESLDQQLKEKELELMREVFNVIETNNTINNIEKIILAKINDAKLTTEQKQLLYELKCKIKRKTMLCNNWTVFQLKFNQVYPNFISRLTTQIQGLTQYELVFISASLMGLATNQIADLLNISEDSVRKSRYRLKKKLGLGKKDDFLEFIHSFNIDS